MNASVIEHINNLYQPEKLPDYFSEYRLLSCLKHSVESQVYLIERNGDKFILKQGSGQMRNIIAEEYGQMQSVGFSFIPKALSLINAESGSWLIREYIEGRTLYDSVGKRGVYSEREAMRVMLSIVGFVTEMHSNNPPVIHRDLKPQNIVITPDGQYKIIDMGTARKYSADKNGDTFYLGTHEIAAPEQFGYAQTDERTDIYALGILLLFMLTGSFDKKEISAVPYKLQAVIKKCIEFDPKRRYQNAGELKKALVRTQERNNIIKIKMSSAILGVSAAIGLLFLFSNPPLDLQPVLPVPEPAERPFVLTVQTQSQTVNFIEPLIEQAVRAALNLSGTDIITNEHLEKVTELCIFANEIIPPEEAMHYQHIPSAYRENPEMHGTIIDISDIAMLVNLKQLTLMAQQIEDISPLAGLPLRFLSLQLNPLTDISPLSECKLIETLYLGYTQINDLSVICELPYLNRLVIMGCDNIRTLEPLRGLYITYLDMVNMSAQDFEAVATLPLSHFAAFWIGEYEQDLLCSVETLRDVYLSYVTVRDFNKYARLPNLNMLSFGSSVILNYDGSENLVSLRNLELHYTMIDVAQLFKMPALRHVLISAAQAEQIYAINADPPFEVRVR